MSPIELFIVCIESATEFEKPRCLAKKSTMNRTEYFLSDFDTLHIGRYYGNDLEMVKEIFEIADNYFEMITDDKNEKWVYFWGTWEGTMKSNNQTYIVPVHLAVRFENNKIVREYGYYNRSQVDAAIKEGQAAAAAPPK